MKRHEYRENGNVTIVEEYKNFNEFTSVAMTRNPNGWAEDHGLARESHDSGWRKCASFEEAQDFLRHGYDKDVSVMLKKISTLEKQGTRAQVHRYADVVGYVPIVPSAILGIPCSMMNSVKKPIKNRVISVLFNPSVSANVSKDEILDFGCKLLGYLLNLEKNGYRVRLEYALPITGLKSNKIRQYILRIPIKSEYNPLNVKRVAFPLAHVGMFRYLAFDWYEHLAGAEYMSGYGTTYNFATDKEKENFTSLLDGNEYMVDFYSDLDKVFEQLN